MFALSRDGQKVFLHQPDIGMVFPVVCDFKRMKLSIGMPSIDELEDDYAVYDEIDEVLAAVDNDKRMLVEAAGTFSAECSKYFHDEISKNNLKISQLRELAKKFHRRAMKSQMKASDVGGLVHRPQEYSISMPGFGRIFSEG